MLAPDWQLKSQLHPMTVSTLLDCVTELGAATQGLFDKRPLFETDGGARILQSIVRQMSVPVRKLCLDDDGALLKKVIANPSFHPLGGNKARYRRASMSWRTQRQEFELGYANGKREAVVVPETDHAIEIGRLYGVDYAEDGWCTIHSPFHLSAAPIPFDTALDAKILQVNSVSYTVRDALSLVVDYEGAHTNEKPAFVSVGVNPDDFDRGRNMKYRLINCVYFGCLSYAHIVVMYSALYIIRRMQRLLAQRAAVERFPEVHVPSVAALIEHIPTDVSFRARIVNATHEMIVVGKSNALDSRRRQPVYRIWSGSPGWDAPVPGASRSEQV